MGQVNNGDVGQLVDIVVVEPTVVESVVGAIVEESVKVDETDSLIVDESVAKVVTAGVEASVEPVNVFELSVTTVDDDCAGAIVAKKIRKMNFNKSCVAKATLQC